MTDPIFLITPIAPIYRTVFKKEKQKVIDIKKKKKYNSETKKKGK
jgi:hypothetical protein